MYGSQISSGVWLAIFILGLVIAILWILLPFAVFGIKNRLDTLIRLTRETNELLTPPIPVLPRPRQDSRDAPSPQAKPPAISHGR